MQIDNLLKVLPERIRDQAVAPPPREGRREPSGRDRPYGQTLEDETSLNRSSLERQREEREEGLVALQERLKPTAEERFLERLRETVNQMNAEAELRHMTLRFSLHEESERWMVRVIDLVEDEVIREIPPEKVLDLSARLRGMIGFIVDSRR